MSLNVWFVPSNTNHLGKTLPLLQRMREGGHHVRIICLDNLLEPVHSTIGQIKATDYEYDIVPVGSYHLDTPPVIKGIRITRVLYCAWQVRKLPALLRAFIETHAQRPDVLIFGSEVYYIDRNFVQAARRLGIPSVLIADGIFLPENPGYYSSVFKKYCAKISQRISRLLHRTGTEGTSGVELVFVVNGTSKEHFVRNGMPADDIHVVGLPEYNVLANRLNGMTADDYRALRNRVGILSDRPIVVFAHQPLGSRDELERMLLEMVEGCRRVGAVLLVKFHPRGEEYPDFWRQWAEKQGLDCNDIVFVRNECTSPDAVIIGMAFITIYSAVVMEALTCRRPILLIKFINTERLLSIGEQYGVAVEVHNEKDLAGAVASIVADEELRKRLLDNYPRAIKRELNDLNENVTDIMLEKIERFIENRRRLARHV
jgi:glycosyltransferase involved in cell wall biosynthesis